MKSKHLFPIIASVLSFVSAALGQTNATMTDIGSATPPPGPYDVGQTLCTYCASSAGTLDNPDGLNYYTDNGANHGLWPGQTFRTGTNSAGYSLASVSIKTGGVDNGGGYDGLKLNHLYLYSVSGSTATLLGHFTNTASFTDGHWVRWNLAASPITLAANTTYAYGFGRDASVGGWAGLGNASGNPYSSGELAMLPTAGGTITFGSSHNYDATFEIGLNAVGAPAVVVSVNPASGLTGQTFTVTATVTPGLGTVTNVAANLGAIGGPVSASLALSNANTYTNTFTVPAGAPTGAAYLAATATDTTPLQGAGGAPFTVLAPKVVTINLSKTYQTIEGLGGATAFYAGWITAHPYRNEIYTNAFAGLNLSMLRLGNWFRYPSSISGFDSAATEIVANANRLLGRPIPVYMSSWAPPAFLKNNGQVANGGSLIYTNGNFAYAAFAQYWYDSIRAYQSNGVDLTWISIQNEPDWVADYDSCIFKPYEEGTNYASYSKALDTVYQKLTNLPSPPKLLAPEVVHIAYNDLANYAATLNGNNFYGINYHLYGGDNNDLASSTNVFPNKPHFMTEFGVDDQIGAATLIHDCLTLAQDSGFNFWNLVWPGTGAGLIQIENPWSAPNAWTNAPAGIPEPHGYWLAPSYWSMKHFSYFITPGFKRVSAASGDNAVLASAYVSPDNLRLVVVLINTNASLPSTVALNYGAFAAGNSVVYQTIGTNAWKSLGALAGSTTLPSFSLTTVVLDKTITVGAASNPSPASGATHVSLNASLSWTPGSNAVTHAVYWGTSSNAVANATPASAEFGGVVWTNEFTLPTASWGTTYYWHVDEIAYSNTNHGSVIGSFTTAPAVQLPSPWQSQDIGGAVSQSSAIFSNGLFSVAGGGADIWGASDAFRFAYLTVTGNCTITARVLGVQNTDSWAKAGVMIRASLDANAANAFMAVTPGNGVSFQYRSTAGGNSANNITTGLNAPYWLRLVRSGNTFTGYRSPDGVTWTQVGSTTISMASTVYIGLAVTAHNSSALCTATFDNVTSPGWSNWTLPPAPAGLSGVAENGQAVLTWQASATATSYNLKRSTTNGGLYSIVANMTAPNYTDTGLTNGTTYYYVVSALNPAGESANSVPLALSPRPLVSLTPAETNLTLSWPQASAGFTVQSRTNLVLGNWVNVTSPAPQMVGSQWQVTLPSTNAGPVFYRLSN